METYSPGPLFYLLVHWIVAAVAIQATAAVVPGFRVKNFAAALVTAAVVGFVDMTVGNVLRILTIPLTILTLGIFWLVVYGMVLKLCSAVLRDFEVRGWFAAIVGGVVLSILKAILHYWIV